MSLFGSFRMLSKGLRRAFRASHVRGLLVMTATLIAVASVFYSWAEGWSLLDSVYFSLCTMATVGYGDLAPQTVVGKLFTMAYIVCGIGVFVATATAIGQEIIKGVPPDEVG